MAVARQSCFASATLHLRAPRASPVPSSVPFPACHALRPRQSLQRGRHDPRLLLPSRRGTRSASARFVLVTVQEQLDRSGTLRRSRCSSIRGGTSVLLIKLLSRRSLGGWITSLSLR